MEVAASASIERRNWPAEQPRDGGGVGVGLWYPDARRQKLNTRKLAQSLNVLARDPSTAVIVLIDDCSPETPAKDVLLDACETTPVAYIQLSENIAVGAIKHAVQVMLRRLRYAATLDGDVALDDTQPMSRAIEGLRAHPDAVGVASNITMWTKYHVHQNPDVRWFTGSHMGDFIVYDSAVVAKVVGYILPELRWAEDGEYSIRLRTLERRIYVDALITGRGSGSGSRADLAPEAAAYVEANCPWAKVLRRADGTVRGHRFNKKNVELYKGREEELRRAPAPYALELERRLWEPVH